MRADLSAESPTQKPLLWSDLLSNPEFTNPPEVVRVHPLIVEASKDLATRITGGSEAKEYLYQVILSPDEVGLEIRPQIGFPIEGDKTRVFEFRPSVVGRSHRKLEYLGSIHSHPDDSPPSFADVGTIAEGEDKFAVVVTSGISYFFVASSGVEPFEGSRVKWDEALYDDFEKRISHASLGEENVTKTVDKITLDQTRDVCKKHSILMYSGTDLKTYSLLKI